MTSQTAKLTPLLLYRRRLEQAGYLPDPLQARAVEELDALYQALQKPAGLFRRKDSIKGLYLWGPVGVGKTFLMDLFHDCLPAGKLRLHFHQFMARIHRELKRENGNKDPLQIIGRRLAREIQVLCLDELYITDIGDGMIVYRLLETLFAEGVVLVTTSNFPPDKLYKDDLQPQLFEPAIALIKDHTLNFHLAGEQDYRLLPRHRRQTYFLFEECDFGELFVNLNPHEDFQTHDLTVCKRPLETLRHSATLAWFGFDALCCGPRSQLDYIELAERFDTILLSDIPVLGGGNQPKNVTIGTEDEEGLSPSGPRQRRFYAQADNAPRRFITLVDELYDRGVNLYLSARVPLDQLYGGKDLSFEFQRTRSRLMEMQSTAYLERGAGGEGG